MKKCFSLLLIFGFSLMIPFLSQAATVVLTDTSPNVSITAGNDTRVYGTAGANHITLENGAKAELFNFPGNNTITIQTDSSLFTVSRSGAYVTFEGADSTVLKIPATLNSQMIVFNDGTGMLIIDSDKVVLGNQTISLTPSTITGITGNTKVASTKQTVIEVAGQGNDLLTIIIPKLPFGQAEDMTIGFKLLYAENSSLPAISIDTDMELDTAVTLEFQSDHLSANEYVFVYHGSTQDYLVPFVKNGNTYTAKLLHFSEYGFKDTPSRASLMNDIETELNALDAYTGNDGIYGLDRYLIGDIVTKINLLEEIDPAMDQGYMPRLIAIIEAAVEMWMIKMKQTTPTYWDGYCIHNDFKTYTVQLAQTMTELELIGGKSIDADVYSLINTHMKAAYEEWKTITPPQPCDISSMLKYIQCAVKFATEAELAGVDISGTEQMEMLATYVENNVIYLVQYAKCPQIDCVKYYLSMSQQHELEYMGISTDYTQALQAKVDELEEKIDTDTCEPLLWRLSINFVQPEITYGTVTYKNFTLDWINPIGTDPYFGDQLAYLSTEDYTDVRTMEPAQVTYTGDLKVDPDMEPLIIYSKGIEFKVTSTSAVGHLLFPQVGSFIWEYAYTHGPIDGCFGNFAADTLDNIKAGKRSEWSSMSKGDGYAYGDFILEPCQNATCE